ncbi:unnamed protein product, partial [Scytosiphon promiscuus]
LGQYRNYPITKNNAVFVDQLHNNPVVFKLRIRTNT